MEKVRIGIIGLGNMGRIHASYLDKGEIANAEIVAVSDTNPEALKWVEGNLDSEVATYSDNDQFFQEVAFVLHLSSRSIHNPPENPGENYRRFRNGDGHNRFAPKHQKYSSIRCGLRVRPWNAYV